MSSKSGTRPGGSRLRVLGYVAAIVLLIMTIALVYYALTNQRTSASPVDPYTPGSVSIDPPIPTEPLTGSGRFLVALDDGTAWRIQGGVCGVTDPVVTMTVDGGVTWVPVELDPALDVNAIVAAQSIEGRLSFLAQLGAGCTGAVVVVTDGVPAVADVAYSGWRIDRASGTAALIGPEGPVAAPCAPVEVAGADDAVVVLCPDQMVLRSSDGGATWGAPLALPGASAVAVTTASFVVVAGHQESCTRLAVIAIPFDVSDASGSLLGCAPITYAPDDTVVDADAGIWIWAGDEGARSVDNGGSWE